MVIVRSMDPLSGVPVGMVIRAIDARLPLIHALIPLAKPEELVE